MRETHQALTPPSNDPVRVLFIRATGWSTIANGNPAGPRKPNQSTESRPAVDRGRSARQKKILLRSGSPTPITSSGPMLISEADLDALTRLLTSSL